MPLTSSLHTHTWRCKHASGAVIDYARAAVAAGMQVLGVSDHSPLPDGRWAEVRMGMNELDAHLADVAAARAACPQLRIELGMECEWDPDYANFYRDELLGRAGCRYLIGACHYLRNADGSWRGAFTGCASLAGLRDYVAQAEATMRSGLFRILAHPDLFGNSRLAWDADTAAAARDLCDVARATDTILELNAYGLRKPPVISADGPRPGYPWRPFWELVAASGCRAIVASDAHRPEDVAHGDELTAWAEDLDIPLVAVEAVVAG